MRKLSLILILICFGLLPAVLGESYQSQSNMGLGRSPELVYYYPGVFPHREARLHSPYLNGDICEINEDYLVQGGDGIEIILVKNGERIPGICHDEATGITPDEPLVSILDEGGQPLYTEKIRPQIPISLLLQSRQIKIELKGITGQIKVRFPDREDEKIKLGITNWSKIQSIFNTASCTNNSCNYKLKVILRPSETSRLFPGDTVDLYRMYKLKLTGEYESNLSDHVPIKVDSSGFIWIPTFNTTNLLSDNSWKSNPMWRQVFTSQDRLMYQVKVWDAGKTYAEQPTADEVADCLSVACDISDEYCYQKEKCLAMGINKKFFSTDNPVKVRYKITPTRRNWTLIDENGRSFEQEYQYGQRLVDSVKEAYRRLTGKELVENGTAQGSVYLVVRNKSVLKNGKEIPYTAPPFYGEVNARQNSRLDDVLIYPNDVVTVFLKDPATVK